MAQHVLNSAQVRTALQQVRGERMAQRVRMQLFATYQATGLLHDAEHALPRQAAAAGVQEHGIRGNGLLAERRAALVHVRRKRLLGLPGQRHHARLAALAHHGHEAVFEMQASQIQPGEFAHAQAAAVQHF